MSINPPNDPQNGLPARPSPQPYPAPHVVPDPAQSDEPARNGRGAFAAAPPYEEPVSDASTVDTVDPATRRLSAEFRGYGEDPDDQPPQKHRSSSATVIREVLETVILAALIFFAVRAVVQNFKVEGSSMVPSFIDGEYMLVNKAVYSRIDLGAIHKVLPFIEPGKNPERYIFHGPQRGDVIVFHPPPAAGGDRKDFIKRIIGVPGDTIDFRDNHVFVNNREVVEPYITATTTCQGQFCHLTLGKDQFFVMGDNRQNSSDSRFWGPVQADKIIGKALLIYWCGGTQCKSGTDNVGLAPNHSPVLALPSGQQGQ